MGGVGGILARLPG